MFYTRDCKYGARPCAFAGGRIVHRALAPAAAVRESIPTRGRRAHSWHRVRMALFKTAAHGTRQWRSARAASHDMCVMHSSALGAGRHGTAWPLLVEPIIVRWQSPRQNPAKFGTLFSVDVGVVVLSSC